jgi:hypothetical protein
MEAVAKSGADGSSLLVPTTERAISVDYRAHITVTAAPNGRLEVCEAPVAGGLVRVVLTCGRSATPGQDGTRLGGFHTA